MDEAVFVFPGQGTQTIGMGADLARDFTEARMVFEEVDDALNTRLSNLMFNGDASELTQTQNAQPAIMAVSMAVWRVLEKQGLKVSAVAGHSLGEYSALCAAQVLSLSDTAKLLQQRGRAMAHACTQGKGGMLALLGATLEQAKEVAKSAGCFVANDNAPGQIVLSGYLDALDKAKEIAGKMCIKRAISLKVAGGFHSPLMQSAADEMSVILNKTLFSVPQIPVYFNVTASIENNPADYADLLTEQITAPVRWRELIQNTRSNCFVECGIGAVLAGLIQRIVPDAKIRSVGTTDDVKSLLRGEK